MKLRTLMLVVTGICLLLGLGRAMFRTATRQVIPTTVLDRLTLGMSMAEVEAILGSPSATRIGHTTQFPTGMTWFYDGALKVGYVEVIFDYSGRLDSVNDESAFPPEYPHEVLGPMTPYKPKD